MEETGGARYVVIVAGGKGVRMGGTCPKQFVCVKGRPVLMRTIDAFTCSACNDVNIVLVLPESQMDYWHELCAKHQFVTPHRLVAGGETRFHSVQNGLNAIPIGEDEQHALVAVHDGVRPFVASEVIERCFQSAAMQGSAIPVVPLIDSLREVKGEKQGTLESVAVARDHYRLVQTPQTFQLEMLRKAYRQPFVPEFTDDASVVESMGETITLVEGNRENIKLTTPFDLAIAECLA